MAAYNSLLKEYLDDLSKEGVTVPQRWVVLAEKYNAGEFQLPNSDFGEIILKIAGLLKPQEEEPKKKKKEKKVEEEIEVQKNEITEESIAKVSEEPKYEESWEDEVVDEEEARNLRVHTRVADEYGDMKEQPEEEE